VTGMTESVFLDLWFVVTPIKSLWKPLASSASNSGLPAGREVEPGVGGAELG
jgi:hypothetical protein